MVQYPAPEYPAPELDGAFAALADPTRRAILERLGTDSATISELAEPFGISLTALKKHVGVLERARLVRSEKVGRSRRCTLGPHTLDDVRIWVDSYRRALAARLDRLDALLVETEGEPDEP
jgi:DNA-binding transcriptional ArsR family regulator